MSNGNGSKGTSLAITEKRHANNGGGGCAGILFQLFRRFARKKIFKRRPLPNPDRAKQVVQKFKGREKMQAGKLNRIADDNKGGCPSTRKNGSRNLVAGQENGSRNLVAGQENGILQAPGLVARLMGLESMPLGQQKLRKNFHRDQKQEKVVRRSRVVRKEDIVEKGETEPGSMLPKTRESDRQVATQFGAESPWVAPAHRVKSPWVSRIQILEPGLQNKSRIKCALPYSSVVQAASAETLTRRSLFPSSDMPRQNFGSAWLISFP